jgi:hypothetical protein
MLGFYFLDLCRTPTARPCPRDVPRERALAAPRARSRRRGPLVPVRCALLVFRRVGACAANGYRVHTAQPRDLRTLKSALG